MKYLLIVIVLSLVGCSYQKDCDFSVPANWKMKQRSSDGKYCIITMDWGYGTYNYLGDYSSWTPFPSDIGQNIPDPDRAGWFSDSCEAKGFCKQYFEQNNRKHKKYDLK